VRDAKQPGFEVSHGLRVVMLGRLDEGVLHDVFTIQRGARHARAVAVQARAQCGQLLLDAVCGLGAGG
jgi:hypothetical protein